MFIFIHFAILVTMEFRFILNEILTHSETRYNLILGSETHTNISQYN